MKHDEPYEVMNEGTPHSVRELVITLVISGILILGLVALSYPRNSQAAGNWCGTWADGYAVGYCLKSKECVYIPPTVCPSPKFENQDAYMDGLATGLINAKEHAVIRETIRNQSEIGSDSD